MKCILIRTAKHIHGINVSSSSGALLSFKADQRAQRNLFSTAVFVALICTLATHKRNEAERNETKRNENENESENEKRKTKTETKTKTKNENEKRKQKTKTKPKNENASVDTHSQPRLGQPAE